MSSHNLGELEGKEDFSTIFDDFPLTWENTTVTDALIKRDYRRALDECLEIITLEDIKRARDYGMNKYSRLNFRESKDTEDHDNFLSANHRSIYRHLVAYQSGETHDPESGCHHVAHIALRCMIAIEYGSASEVGSGLQGSGDSGCLGSQPTYPTYDTTPIECATSGSPTLREILKRGDEMPQWLIDLIEMRTERGCEMDRNVDTRFDFTNRPEGSAFWRDVQSFQSGTSDDLPDEPKRTGGVK